MTILWADGFEDATSMVGEYEQGSAPTIVAGQGRRGSAALRIDVFNEYVQRALGASESEVFASFALNMEASSGNCILVFYSGSTVQVRIDANADGSFTAYRNTTSLGSTAPGLFILGAYVHVQVRVVFDNAAGVVQLRINGAGTLALDLTGVDTDNAAGSVCTALRIGGTGGNTRYAYVDDFVVWDTAGTIANTWLGDTRVDSYRPNGNGSSSDFVGSDADSTDNYLLVDAPAPNGTDYVESATVNDLDLYACADMAHTPAAIYGLLVTASASKADAGERSIALHASSGATDSAGASQALSTSRMRHAELFEVDPDTGLAWTTSGVNAAEFGIEVSV